MLRAGQLAAQAGAAHFQIVALVDGVGLVQDGVQCVGNICAGIGVHGAVLVDEDAKIPVRPFLFKNDIPQAQAHALHGGADKRFDSLGGVAARLLRHKKPPNKQETRTLRPTFQVKLYRTTRIYHTSRDYASIFADFFRRRVFYSTHTPSRNSSTVRPSRHLPVIWLSSAPIITSSCRRDWFMPRASSSSFVSAVPPFVVPG